MCDLFSWVSGVIGRRGWIKLIFRNPSTGKTVAARLRQRARVKFLCWITSATPGRRQPCQCLLPTDRCAEKQLNHTATSCVLHQQSLSWFPKIHLGMSCVWRWCGYHAPVRAPRHEGVVSWISTPRMFLLSPTQNLKPSEKRTRLRHAPP